jgi:hypothetical protein
MCESVAEESASGQNLHQWSALPVCQREQQIFQVRQGVAHVQRPQIMICHELLFPVICGTMSSGRKSYHLDIFVQ